MAELGVELVVAEENDRMEGVYLFQLATGPESGNIGGMPMWRVMSLYPAILSLGVTDIAERMYQVLRWKHYEQVRRGVHPICTARMPEDYGGRIQTAWHRHALRGLSLVQDLAAPRVRLWLAGEFPAKSGTRRANPRAREKSWPAISSGFARCRSKR